MAKACYSVSSERRWVMTGTPIVNKLDDIYSLLKFLNLQPWNQLYMWQHFVAAPFARREPKALNLVHDILSKIMIRRTKGMKDENGNPIVHLPPKHVQVKYFDFSDHERVIYDKLLRSSQMRLHWLKGSGKADFSQLSEGLSLT